jgi:hypothetical protein
MIAMTLLQYVTKELAVARARHNASWPEAVTAATKIELANMVNDPRAPDDLKLAAQQVLAMPTW